MRFLLFFLFLNSSLVWGQISYTSTVTRHFPSEEVEEIKKTVMIDEVMIRIISQTAEEKDQIDSLNISRKFRRNLDDVINSGESMIYHCLSTDKKTEYIITIPETAKVEFIDVYIPQQANKRSQYYRLILD